MALFSGLFGKPTAQPVERVVVIEVDKPHRPVAPLNQDMRDGLRAALHLPAIQYLLSKLQLEKAYLERQLKQGRHTNITDVNFLQNGIYWAEWLERQFTLAEKNSPSEHEFSKQYELKDGDQQALEEIMKQVRSVS